MTIDTGFSFLSTDNFLELPRKAANQRHFVIRNAQALRQLLAWANQQGYYLANIVATDDRLLVDRAFKLYYILSGTKDEIVILEHFVSADNPVYDSIADVFPNAQPLEKEIGDMFGVIARDKEQRVSGLGFLLHPETYPADFYPLRRRRTLENLQKRFENFSPLATESQPSVHLPEGMLIVPVGPIHAGVIEAGHFPFHVAGEVVEELPIRLGYKHRGVEKLFETHYTLQEGWKLAEKISGDSSVAHAIAYCQAVEDFAQIELPLAIYQWRALFLELERMYNHISDIGLLATGMAYEQAASKLATLRELFVHFVNVPLSGNRFLRGLNSPGRVAPSDVNLSELSDTLEAITEEALEQGKEIMERQDCRERMLSTGTLTEVEARYATGFIARASGWHQHDFRLRHPSPAYASDHIQRCLQETVTPEEVPSQRIVPVHFHDLKGDVFARLAIRVAELETSLYLVKGFFEQLSSAKNSCNFEDALQVHLARLPEMSIGLGYVEGWRGDVMYVIFKGMENTIARCKVRDSSVFNWHAFPLAVQRKSDELQNILADFPLINKSFNLSYAGHDL